ncbi:hypothetical protein K466DRAFT_606627 [Polyporus arcularius HHB13444]|uniref:Uncharacterized protein n=1 Tax=Polyporus arcularius HHB13444 TaxID=1314778 RepID=A0A5C3NZD7_9APHY|nr:hypothetical protein K466DRAFT_606627 [Polyporus arcularius HHB13444]
MSSNEITSTTAATDADPGMDRIVMTVYNPPLNSLPPPLNSLPMERVTLSSKVDHDLPRPAEVREAHQYFEIAALNLKDKIALLAGGEARVEFLKNFVMFIGGAPLRTYVLHIVGKTSGDKAEFILPGSPAVLYLLPVRDFMNWVRAFECGEFGVTDAITPAQRELLVDFARIWEGFAREPYVSGGWYQFIALLRTLATDTWSMNTEYDDGGFSQLSLLSEWARRYYPDWFRTLEDMEDVDPEMPELVEVYGSDSENDVDVA